MKLDYRCYSAADLDARDDGRPWRGQRLFVDLGTRQCWLIWKKDYLCDMPHCDFYAASPGWEDFTTTGYRSTFLWREWVECFGDELDDAQALQLLRLIHDYNEVELVDDKPVQTSLFG